MKLNNQIKLNNQGFAITGILYTLFILFLLILVSVLGGLSSKKNMLEQSIVSEENSFTGTEIAPNEAIINDITTVKGKYIFLREDSGTKCIAYLDKNTNIITDSITYIPNDCNLYESNFTKDNLERVYSFEKE